MDRREIFNKYIQRSSEVSDSVRPFCSDDPELSLNEMKDRNQDEFLVSPNNKLTKAQLQEGLETRPNKGEEEGLDSANKKKEFRLVRLAFDMSHWAQLGIFLARQEQVDIGCYGYFVAHIVPTGLVMR